MEEPSASGRYIASLQHAIDTKLAVDALQQRFPGYKLPKGKQGEREQVIDNSKVGLPPERLCLWHSGTSMGRDCSLLPVEIEAGHQQKQGGPVLQFPWSACWACCSGPDRGAGYLIACIAVDSPASYQIPQCWLGKPAAAYRLEQHFRWLPTDGQATRKLRALCRQLKWLLLVMAPAARNVSKLSSCCCRS